MLKKEDSARAAPQRPHPEGQRRQGRLFPGRLVCLAGASLLMIGVLNLPQAMGRTASTSIKLKPSYGPPTTRTVVKGAGFGPVELVRITFGAKQVGQADTDESGSFSAKVRVPRSAKPGEHIITATGQSSGLQASATFLVRTDWKGFHFDNANTGFNPYENVLGPGNVDRLGLRWAYPTGSWVDSSPAVADGTVYVGSEDGKLYALDAATGALKWAYPTGSYVDSSPAVSGGEEPTGNPVRSGMRPARHLSLP